jgi:transposase-like protein
VDLLPVPEYLGSVHAGAGVHHRHAFDHGGSPSWRGQGDLELPIPKLRAGSFFPSLLERRRRVDQALFAAVMVAYLHGVSTRKVDDLVHALRG